MIDPSAPASRGAQALARATGGAGLAALLLGLVAGFEGKRNDPYDDLIGRATVCYGETGVAMRHYTDAQCRDLLAGTLAGTAAQVHAATPTITGAQLAAATSLAYNIGTGAYARSSVARDFRAGRPGAACDDFLRYDHAGGHAVPGLMRRRAAERALCLKGLP